MTTHEILQNDVDTSGADRLPDNSQPYVLQRDEGVHLHFLNTLATQKLTAGERSSMTVVEFDQPRGFGPPLHCHDDEDELIVVLDGEISFRSGEVEAVGRAGSIVHLPHGVPHTFQVISETARMLTVTSSADTAPRFDRFVGALGAPTPMPVIPQPGEIDPHEVASVGAAHGIEILGPPPAPLD